MRTPTMKTNGIVDIATNASGTLIVSINANASTATRIART